PLRADGRGVVGEVEGRAGVAGAVDRRDLQVGQRHAHVQGGDGRVVPIRDLAEEDVGDHLAGEVQVHRPVRDVVRDRRPGERPRNLDTAVTGVQLVGRERRVGGAEVDGAVRNRLNSAAGADGAVLDGVV